MQKELDKIERFAREVAEKSKIDQTSAEKLLSGVKVCNYSIQLFWTLVLATEPIFKEFVSRYRVQLYELDKMGSEMDETYRELLVNTS